MTAARLFVFVFAAAGVLAAAAAAATETFGAAASCTDAATMRYSVGGISPTSCCYVFENTPHAGAEDVVAHWEVQIAYGTRSVVLPDRVLPVVDSIDDVAAAHSCSVRAVSHLADDGGGAWVRLDLAPWSPLEITNSGHVRVNVPPVNDWGKFVLLDGVLLRLDLDCDDAASSVHTQSCLMMVMDVRMPQAGVGAAGRGIGARRIAFDEAQWATPTPRRSALRECIRTLQEETTCAPWENPDLHARLAATPAGAPAAGPGATESPFVAPAVVVIYRVRIELEPLHAGADPHAGSLALTSAFAHCQGCELARRTAFCDAHYAGGLLPLHHSFPIEDAQRPGALFYHVLWDGGGLCFVDVHAASATIGFRQCDFALADGVRYRLRAASITPLETVAQEVFVAAGASESAWCDSYARSTGQMHARTDADADAGTGAGADSAGFVQRGPAVISVERVVLAA